MLKLPFASAPFTACAACTACAFFALTSILPPALSADAGPWEKAPPIPAESDFLQDRLSEPQNHFLLDATQGFVSGRSFYQSVGENAPFLWFAHPFLQYNPDRAWQDDSLPILFTAGYGQDPKNLPYTTGEVNWAALSELRLHAALDQNDEYSSRTLPFRANLVGDKNRDQYSWLGDNLPSRSVLDVGGTFRHRGALMAAQYNQGWWWMASPASGMTLPWEGYDTDILYSLEDEFNMSLVDQEWDTKVPGHFFKAHWHRSELDLGFLGSSEGPWVWRFDIGYQQRSLDADSAFHSFSDKTYPVRFRYRELWSAPDELPFKLLTQGSMSVRDELFSFQHSMEFQETVGPHHPIQILKGYYRHPFDSYKNPIEYFSGDSTLTAESQLGSDVRGAAATAEYRFQQENYELSAAADYGLEWENPLFHLNTLDTLDGMLIRSGAYLPSDYMLSNATARAFAGGGKTDKATWRIQGGLRRFWGHDADSMEFLPSPWWAGAGGTCALPRHLLIATMVNYLGPKEVRGWGPLFKVPSHFENSVSVTESLFADQLKLSATALHAFGDAVLEQPNGNRVRFRFLLAAQGAF